MGSRHRVVVAGVALVVGLLAPAGPTAAQLLGGGASTTVPTPTTRPPMTLPPTTAAPPTTAPAPTTTAPGDRPPAAPPTTRWGATSTSLPRTTTSSATVSTSTTVLRGAADRPTTTTTSTLPVGQAVSAASPSTGSVVALIITGLLAVACALSYVTLRYWRATRPGGGSPA